MHRTRYVSVFLLLLLLLLLMMGIVETIKHLSRNVMDKLRRQNVVSASVSVCAAVTGLVAVASLVAITGLVTVTVAVTSVVTVAIAAGNGADGVAESATDGVAEELGRADIKDLGGVGDGLDSVVDGLSDGVEVASEAVNGVGDTTDDGSIVSDARDTTAYGHVLDNGNATLDVGIDVEEVAKVENVIEVETVSDAVDRGGGITEAKNLTLDVGTDVGNLTNIYVGSDSMDSVSDTTEDLALGIGTNVGNVTDVYAGSDSMDSVSNTAEVENLTLDIGADVGNLTNVDISRDTVNSVGDSRENWEIELALGVGAYVRNLADIDIGGNAVNSVGDSRDNWEVELAPDIADDPGLGNIANKVVNGPGKTANNDLALSVQEAAGEAAGVNIVGNTSDGFNKVASSASDRSKSASKAKLRCWCRKDRCGQGEDGNSDVRTHLDCGWVD
jgi:hypothetical protein